MSAFPSEEIKSRLDIADVLSGYIKLNKVGGSYRALCPFHNEKTPSLYLSIPKQIWHCFGCGEGGDIFKFVMKMEGVEFVEALRILAKKAGVVLKAQDPKLANERTMLQDVCAQAARFFRNNLESASGAEALAYLKERGLTEETIREFQIGYAQSSWDGLYNFLTMKGYKPDILEKAGLVLASEKSGTKKYFDRFRDRIMFPIADANGTVVAFTGRYVKKREDEGKYVNSPQTLLYNKSAILYGLDKAKQEIRRHNSVVLMEGQMDLIMAWQDGVRNTAAVSGTAFTSQQLALIKRYTPNITLLFDADVAGDAATQKSIALAQGAGFNITVVRQHEGKDPADFVLAHPGKLAEHIARAVSIMDYYFESTFAKYDAKNVEGKKEIARVLLAQIKKIPNQIEAHHWLEQLSTRLATGMDYLEAEMRAMKEEQTFLPEHEEARQEEEKPKAKKTPLDKLLEHYMALVYSVKDAGHKKAILASLKEFGFLSGLIKTRPENGGLVSQSTLALFDFFVKYGSIDQLEKDFESQLSEGQKDIFNEIVLMSELEEYPDVGKEAAVCASRIERMLIDRRLEELTLGVKQAGSAGDAKLEEHLFNEVSALGERKNKLTHIQQNHNTKQ
jgi:DNA primase